MIVVRHHSPSPAHAQVLAWTLRREGVLAAMRDAERQTTTRSAKGARHALFLVARLLHSLQVKHDTLAVFFGPADDPVPREFRATLLLSTLLVILTVDVWMCACPHVSALRASACTPGEQPPGSVSRSLHTRASH